MHAIYVAQRHGFVGAVVEQRQSPVISPLDAESSALVQCILGCLE